MRTVAAAVVAVMIFTALSAWYFYFREVPESIPQEKVLLAEALAEVSTPDETPSASSPTPDVATVTPPDVAESEVSGRASSTFAFYGTVQAGSSGTPVAGATVRVLSRSLDQDAIGSGNETIENALQALKVTTTTDQDGVYRLEFEDMEIALLAFANLACEAPGFARSLVPLVTVGDFSPGREERRDFFLKAGSLVTGRVTRADTGAPVAGAEITAIKVRNFMDFGSELFDVPEIATISAEDGQYSLVGLDEAAYTLSASTPDQSLLLPTMSRPRIKIVPGQDLQKDLVLSSSAAVRGTVTFAGSAARPESARVNVQRQPTEDDYSSDAHNVIMNDELSSHTGNLDESNGYSVGGLEFGATYTVGVHAEGYAQVSSEPFTIAEGQSPVTIDLVASRGSTLRGKAVYDDGKPAADVNLLLMHTPSAKAVIVVGRSHTDETDADGAFEMANVGAGEYKIGRQEDLFGGMNPFNQGSAEEKEKSRVVVDGIKDLNNLVVTVKGNAPVADGVISGVVLDVSGKPVEGVGVHAFAGIRNIRAEMRDATTAADGTFRLEKLTEEEYDVSAAINQESAKAEAVAVGSDITLQLKPKTTISGTVTDAAGDPVDGCTVKLEERKEIAATDFDPAQMMQMFNPSGGATTRSDSLGQFSFETTEPGRYVLRVLASSAGYGESEPFDIAEGESKSGLNIRLSKGVALSGTVVDTGGKPISGARVLLAEMREAGPMMDEMMDLMPDMMQQGAEVNETDENGVFAFYNLAPGDYRLRASAEGFAKSNGSVAMTAGRDLTGHRITLTQGGCIAGTASVKGVVKAGLMVQAVGSGGTKQTTSGEDGHFELCGLSAGSYMVTAMDIGSVTAGDFSNMMPTMRKADVRDGETTEVDFGPKEGAVSVRGVVHGERGTMTTVSLQKPGAPQPDPANMFNMDAAMEMMEFMGGQAMCDASGAFEIHEVTPGEYVLEVHSVTIDFANVAENAEMFGESMKPAVRQEVTVPAGTGLTIELELPAKE